MDYQKLLFAAEVHRLAGELRAAERQQKMRRESGLTGEDLRIATERWDAEHKVMSFVPQAVALITNVAEMIEPIKDYPTSLEINGPY